MRVTESQHSGCGGHSGTAPQRSGLGLQQNCGECDCCLFARTPWAAVQSRAAGAHEEAPPLPPPVRLQAEPCGGRAPTGRTIRRTQRGGAGAGGASTLTPSVWAAHEAFTFLALMCKYKRLCLSLPSAQPGSTEPGDVGLWGSEPRACSHACLCHLSSATNHVPGPRGMALWRQCGAASPGSSSP